jgi:hypothetical protein
MAVRAQTSLASVIFGLFSITHVFELFSHWSTIGTDRWFTLGMTAVIVVSGALSIWALFAVEDGTARFCLNAGHPGDSNVSDD